MGTQRLCLELLETLTSNCEKVFSEVASEKVLEEMVRVIEDPKADEEVARRGFEMVRAWGQNDDLMYLPVFHQTYMVNFFNSWYMCVLCDFVGWCEGFLSVVVGYVACLIWKGLCELCL